MIINKNEISSYMRLEMKFSGPSTFDQPYRIARDYRACNILASRGQIFDPRMVDLNRYDVDYQGRAEHVVAEDLHKALTNRFGVAGDYLRIYGKFYGFFALHQLRAFFIRHGLSPFFPGATPVYFDTSYINREIENELAVQYLTSLNMIEENKEFVRDQHYSGKLFIASVSARPPIAIKSYLENYVSTELYRSVFKVVCYNKEGFVLLDFASLNHHERTQGPIDTLVGLEKFLFWMNYRSSYLFVPSDEKHLKLFNHESCPHIGGIKKDRTIKGEVANQEILTKNYLELIAGKMRNLDVEMNIYSIDPTKLSALKNAIYHKNISGLATQPTPHLRNLYFRHLMRLHKWSHHPKYTQSRTEEDEDAKKTLRSYCRARYSVTNTNLKTAYEYSPMAPTTMEEFGDVGSLLDPEHKENFEKMFRKSEAVKAYFEAVCEESDVG